MRSQTVSDHARRTARRVASLIAKADALLITAGAGMSVDSALPDFRSPQGLWRANPPLGQLGLSFEQMAQPQWFAHQPEMAWAWYGHRQARYRETVPHAGYAMLRGWMQPMSAGGFVVTSNVDGQFVAAGFPASHIVERHGSIHRHQCTVPCSDTVWDAAAPDLKIDMAVLRAKGELPRCPDCGALARPNVMMFNDGAWVDAVRRQQQARYEAWLARARGRRIVVIECGAGTSSASVRRISERVAERSRTALVRINPAATEADEPTFVLRLPALQALALIDEAMPEEFRRRCTRVDAAAEVAEAPSNDPSVGAEEAGEPAAIEGPPRPPPPHIRLDIGPVLQVDLGLGVVGRCHPDGLSREDQLACVKRYLEAQRDWVPLPCVGGRSVPGFTMRAMSFSSRDAAGGGPAGAALVIVQDPDEYAVLSIGVARLASEGPFLWKLLYETASRPLAALDYPPVAWLALRPDACAAQHAAVMPSLVEIGRAFAWGWLRWQAFMQSR